MSRDGERRTLRLIAPLIWVSNLGAIIHVNIRTQEDDNRNKVNRQETRRFYSVVWLMPTPRCDDLLRSRVVKETVMPKRGGEVGLLKLFLH
jgi:hypothetical protein